MTGVQTCALPISAVNTAAAILPHRQRNQGAVLPLLSLRFFAFSIKSITIPSLLFPATYYVTVQPCHSYDLTIEILLSIVWPECIFSPIISAWLNCCYCSLRSQQQAFCEGFRHRNRKISDFAHYDLGFVTQKARENASRRHRVNSNELLPYYGQNAVFDFILYLLYNKITV